jgi:hypothetical protein
MLNNVDVTTVSATQVFQAAQVRIGVHPALEVSKTFSAIYSASVTFSEVVERAAAGRRRNEART